MPKVHAGERIKLENILYLTDYSEPSEAALPFVSAIAREFSAKVLALHILIPEANSYTTPELTMMSIEAQEEVARDNMRLVGSQLAGIPHETVVERGIAVWPSLERAIEKHAIDMVVLGTHGRTGARKLLLGSVAEDIFRRSPVPVLTIGPAVPHQLRKEAKFQRVLLAADFTAESLAAAPYAISMAQENQARLILLHVITELDAQAKEPADGDAIYELMARVHAIVPPGAELWCRSEVVLQYGNPADKILETAKQREADLIVLGVRDPKGHMGAAIHLERAVAHQVVAHALCPVLTVRS